MKYPKAVEIFREFYLSFDVKNRELFYNLYDSQVLFQDPFHTVKGRDELYAYFLRLMERVKECRFEILDITLNDKESACVVWDMYLSHPMMNKGREIRVPGSTYLKLKNDKVTFHRDYFDSSQLIYKNVPILGSIIGLIEKRL